MNFRKKVLAALAVTLLIAGQEADQFKSLHALIRPQGKELAWTQIPWLSDLWEARRRASESGRPLFLWEMDGHPLGCT